jgi:N-methylhydantoinase A
VGAPPTGGSLGVDVGGTFTDLVVWDGATVRAGKVATTPDQADGVVAGASGLDAGPLREFLHGTTVATNALLERRGARTALVTTTGFEDVLEIGRQDRPSLYDTAADRPVPLVPGDARFGYRDDATAVAAAVAAVAPEAVAVSLLYSFRDPGPEHQVAAALREALPGVPLSLSSEVVAEFREFERTSTTVLNAYLAPVTGGYLGRLVDRAAGSGLPADVAVMRSSGGLMPARRAAALPAAVLLSGPAGGVVAAAALGEVMGRSHLISFDMGGTSTDVCRIEDARPTITYERPVEGYPCRMPSVAIHTVGAGGGSIGWIDAGGSLRVGPRSAGAVPGPACYGGGGTEPAVTDADLVLGRIDPVARLAGSLEVSVAPARVALESVGSAVDLDAVGTALGMVEVVEEHMAGAIRKVSIEEGADPRRSALLAFGGAGGMHATALARRLDMAGVIVPAHAGVFSALGLLLSPPRADVARSVLLDAGEGGRLDAAVGEVAAAATAELRRTTGADPDGIDTLVDVRYRGQSHEIAVPYRPGWGWERLAADFHEAHRSRNGFARPGDPIEAVTARAEAVGRPVLTIDAVVPGVPAGEARRGVRPVVTPGGTAEAAVWWRPAMASGDEVVGPAVVEEPNATTYLAAGERAVVHATGALEVEW